MAQHSTARRCHAVHNYGLNTVQFVTVNRAISERWVLAGTPPRYSSKSIKHTAACFPENFDQLLIESRHCLTTIDPHSDNDVPAQHSNQPLCPLSTLPLTMQPSVFDDYWQLFSGIHIECRINIQVNISLSVIDLCRCRWTNYVRVCACTCVCFCRVSDDAAVSDVIFIICVTRVTRNCSLRVTWCPACNAMSVQGQWISPHSLTEWRHCPTIFCITDLNT